MDNLLLEAIVAELRAQLVGWSVHRASAAPDSGLILFFEDPSRSRLLISDAPTLSRLHLTREAVRRPGHDPGFASMAAHHLGGAILARIDKDPAERVVRFCFAGASGPGKSLVAELLGRTSNLVLLDGEERVLGFSRRLKAEHRRPVVGSRYEPPPRRGDRLDPRRFTETAVEDLVARSRRESHPLADLLLESSPALGGLAALEIEHRAAAGEPAFAALRDWLDRAFAGSHEAESPVVAQDDTGPRDTPGGERSPAGYLYCEGEPAEMDLRRAPSPGRHLLSPLPLASAGADLTCHTYASLNEAADAYYGPLASGVALRAHRDALMAVARREATRARGIVVKVSRELEAMQGADRYRVFGEALLAGLTRAARRGDTVIVPDPYGAEGDTISIPIDPAATLPTNAERFFRKHRKAERGRAVAARRRSEQQNRSQVFEALAERIGAVSGEDGLVSAEEDLRRSGVAVGLERRRPKGPSAPPPVEAGVRLYRSSEGHEILVGKQAEENDRLTFKIASPEDFWLHASGASGAHVVVRNPHGQTHLPAPTLREAAELAAFFSRAKGEGRVDVIVTRRKYVRRVRGAPRGTVTVKKHETIVVAPRNPFDTST